MRSKARGWGGWWLLPLLAIAGLAAPSGDPRLVEAVENRNQEAVRSLLKERVDVNATQADGATALAWAAHWDDLETADLLIRAGANANAANDYGVTPLSLACTNGSAAMVGKLLDAGANPNAALPSGETPLMTCARTGNAEAVTSLLAHRADVNAKETWRGQTALMWAVAEKHPEVARVLVERGADVRARSNAGFTPLLFAAQQGDLDSARILLDAGAPVNESTPNGMSVLLTASASGQAALSAFLLEKGADPNAADRNGYTALHYAASRRNMLELVKALLARRADPNARITKDSSSGGGVSLAGATPFFLAAGAGNLAAMRALAAGGADPLMATKENTTPLMNGIGVGRFDERTEGQLKAYLETAQLAVEMGADINAAGENGWTALHAAAYAGADAVIQLLVEKGAQLDAKDKFGQTPLSIAEAVITVEMADYADPRPRRFRQSTADLLLKLGATPTADAGVRRLGSTAVTQP